MKLYMFPTVPLSIIRSFFTVHSATVYRVRQESNETGAIFFYLTFTYKSTLSPSK